MSKYYEIKVNGLLDPGWSDWFAGIKVSHLKGEVTLLSGQFPDQAALHGMLKRIRDLNLTLLSITSSDPPEAYPDPEVD